MALIIFDIDGTLFETQRVTVPAVRKTFAAYGLKEPDPDTICTFFGRSVASYEAWLAGLCPPDMAAEIVDATNRRELALIREAGRLYPGVREALDALRKAGHRMAVCSNGPEGYVGEFLDAFDLRGFFDAVFTRGARFQGKQDMIAEVLRAIPDRPVFMVGDRQDDVSGAHENGARAIGAHYGFGGETELANADAVANAAEELPEIIARLLASA
jgi:phosphoglycolate phosphatase-like HAD superfamily hydrolase